MSRGGRSAASVYRCPECGSEQPEPGTCGRCPGTVREARSAATVDYDGPDESVGCAFPGCTNRLRRSNFGPSQFCSKAHRDGRRVYEFKTSKSMSRDGWYIVKQRIASGSGGWEVVASVFGGRCAEIVRDALSKEANLDV